MAPLLELWLLGPWQAQLNQTPFAPFPSRHTQVLLARLAVEHPRPLPRTRLLTDLFPDSTQKHALPRLRTTLYFLRRALGTYLVSDNKQVGLDPALVVVHDLARFEAATAPGASQLMLAEAVTLYRGPFLQHPSEGWAATEARRIHDRYIDTLRRLVAIAEASGTSEAALDVAERWVAEEPWDEIAHSAVIRAFMARHDYDAAQRHIMEARDLLRTEWSDTQRPIIEELARAVARGKRLHPSDGMPLTRHDQLGKPAPQPRTQPTPTQAISEQVDSTRDDQGWETSLVTALETAERARIEGHWQALLYALEAVERAADRLILPALDERQFRLRALRERYCAVADPGEAWTDSLEALSHLAEMSQRPDWRIEALTRRGNALLERGQPSLAQNVLHQAIKLAQKADLPLLEGQVRLAVSYLLEDMGDITMAVAESAAAARIGQAIENNELRLMAAIRLAFQQMYAGYTTAAQDTITALLTEPAVRHYPPFIPMAQCVQGLVQIASHEYAAGLRQLRESVRQMQQFGEQRAMSLCQSTLCFVLVHLGLYTEAQALAEATIPLAQEINDLRRLSVLLYCMARIALHKGETEYAWHLAQECYGIITTLQMPYYLAVNLGQITEVAIAAGRQSAARESIERLEPLLTRVENVNIGHIVARVWLVFGQSERARRAAYVAIHKLTTTGLMAITASEALWIAADVIAQVDGEQAAQPFQERAAAQFLDDVVALGEPFLRRAFIAATSTHRDMASFTSTKPRRLVFLPLKAAPTGRPLQPDELAPVVWTLHTPGDPPSGGARRRHQLQRLATEAAAQSASPTVRSLAEALTVSERTILSDLQILRQIGVAVETRGGTGRNRKP